MWKKICERLFGGNAEAAVSDERQNALVREILAAEIVDRRAARNTRAKSKRRKRALPSLFDDEVASEIKRRLTAYEYGKTEA
jgi:hypothetical protein